MNKMESELCMKVMEMERNFSCLEEKKSEIDMQQYDYEAFEKKSKDQKIELKNEMQKV